jgi:hypothetical protein
VFTANAVVHFGLISSGMTPEHWVLAAKPNSSFDMSILKIRPQSCLETPGTNHTATRRHIPRDGGPLFSSASYILSSLLKFLFSYFPLLSLLSFPFRIDLLFSPPFSLRRFMFYSTCLSLKVEQLSRHVINQ